MTSRSRRILILVLLALLGLLVLLFTQCSPRGPDVFEPNQSLTPAATTASSEPRPAPIETVERLTPATLTAPAEVPAGTPFRVQWTGPDNPGDYLTIVPPQAPNTVYEYYRETRGGPNLELVAPIQSGSWELRYVTLRSKQVLARAAIEVTATRVTLSAPDEVIIGSPVSVSWIGPGNPGDFITIVPLAAPDSQIGHSVTVGSASSAIVTAPVQSGPAEIRYISGQGRSVLARRTTKVIAPETTLDAAASVIVGAKFSVSWRGPGNKGDYITVVPKGTPDGQYRNYTDTSKGSTLELTAPIDSGSAELRYMSGTEARVLARRPIAVLAARVNLEASDEVVAGSPIVITWTGPMNANDYITVVPQSTPDGQYGNYTDASKGSPLAVTAPIRTGAAEIRYMSGQGARVLARRAVQVVPAFIEISAPKEVGLESSFTVEWKGPNHPGDYLAMTMKSAKNGVALRTVPTSRGSPVTFLASKEPGAYEIRYISSQGNVILARTEVQVR